MLRHWIDERLTRAHGDVRVDEPFVRISTPVGPLRALDSGGHNRPCVVITPDGPNVIEHYRALIGLLGDQVRVICFDMPGFGFSRPRRDYDHSLAKGASAVLGVLDAFAVSRATLAFSCANGFYAMEAARLAPQRIASLVLAQTPSLETMHRWVERVIPGVLKVPVVGQVLGHLVRRKAADRWYGAALARNTHPASYSGVSHDAFGAGACFCLASVVQSLIRASTPVLKGIDVPCTVVWGNQDRSHRGSRPESLLAFVPQAEVICFGDCGHFPDLESSGRFASILLSDILRRA